ncbi:cell division protein SepF [Ferviditalea candida]|uniref:Cell division protein SepF n=1 Tax=Ferviditalea candida TaxID=3108399 RepID=A0ABU5ZDN2_9BACL|nr:cell division protein SepF [Paenibacillaceae bacterium T2]
MGVFNKFMGFLGLQEEEEIIERERFEEPENETNFPSNRKNRGNIVGIPSQKPTKMILSEPRSYEETQQIADHLRSRRPVVVNLHKVRSDLAVRIVDFLSGTVYALNGGISKLGPNIFLCTPESVEIQGTITETLEGDGDYNKMR